jgi:hypothetical protein
MKKLLGAVAIAAVMLTGCVSTSVTMLGGTETLPATVPQTVVLYRLASQVPGTYRELALLDSVGDANATNQTQMYNSMRVKAAKIGANGIILDATTEPGAMAQVVGAIFGAGANRRGKAIAIYVEGAPVTLAPLPAAQRRGS